LKKIIKKNSQIIISFLLISFFFIALVEYQFSLREYFFFRDHAIIWDSVFKLNGDLKIYSDFGVPTGPITYYLSFFLVKIFGLSGYGFHLVQLFQSYFLVLFSIMIIWKLQHNIFVALVSGLVCSFFYVNLLWFPWYNTTAVLFLFSAVYLYFINFKFKQFVIGIFISMSFLSKQDIGLLAFLILLSINFYDNFIVGKTLKKFLLQSTEVLIGFLLSFLLIFIWIDFEKFIYWFNMGQDYQTSRFSDVLNIFRKPGIYFFAFFIYLALKKNNRNIFLYSLFILSSSISTVTSGLSEHHFYYLFTIPPLIYELKKELDSEKIFYLISTFGFLTLLFPISRQYFIYQNIFLKKHDHYAFSHKKLNTKNVDISKCLPDFKYISIPTDLCRLINDISRIKTFIKKPSNNILNFSEFNGISKFVNMQNLTGQPLWYHDGVTFFSNEKQKLEEQILSGIFDIIVLQNSRTEESWIEKFILNNPHYIKSRNIYKSPSMVTDTYKLNENNIDKKNDFYIYFMYKKNAK